ncbi:MAG: glycosyltransferase family 39 protein, partial [Candidatus Krumholzibacteria bacterium]|nr:glycosyltransferase family 39 protein [Candidatus Krumholzibacteria bacterium]
MTGAIEKPRWDFTVLAIIFAGAALRFVALGQQSYWVDETRSISIALGEYQIRWIDTALDIHGPLHMMLLKLWMTLVGTAEAATRAMSAIFGALGLVVFYRVGVPLVGRRAAMIA